MPPGTLTKRAKNWYDHKIMAKAVYKFYTQRQPTGHILAFVPNLPGCRFKGQQLSGALENAKPRIEGHLKALTRAGKRIPPNPHIGVQVWDVAVNLPVTASSTGAKRKIAKTIYKFCKQRQSNGQAFAFVPNLPGCIFEGQNSNEVLEKAKLCIETHLKNLAQEGKQLPPNPLISIQEWDIIVNRPSVKAPRTSKRL
jgi:predicted RNase H-like HicB family nuclease